MGLVDSTMNGAPGRRVPATSAQMVFIWAWVRISTKTLRLTAPSTEASGSGIASSMSKNVALSMARDRAAWSMFWSWSTP
jgi:hypothetical protein